ncbi:MAG TPA: 3-hydroxyacyl-CoA dehydrogenase family protein [Planctomycetes bacterium]|nr:3-hydroxyacyl-CoA dehydrogenase family protein [Planctomycetota bacterium]
MKHIDALETAAVLGSGTMGHGIAQVLAQSGLTVRMYDISDEFLAKATERIAANLEKGVARGKIEPAARDEALARLSTTTKLEDAIDGVDVVVEAVPERIELKRELFTTLGANLGPDVLLATNTSSLPITEIAAAAQHPERVTGMHFFNPVHIMKLVEVVQAEQSSDDAVELTLALARRMGKEPIRVRDAPGFASSRLGLVIGLEAIRMVEEGVASAEDIDRAMTLGYGFPVGPLKLTDIVGLDVRLSIAEHLAREIGSHFQPPALLREKVERGELGKKVGKGFYEWDGAR